MALLVQRSAPVRRVPRTLAVRHLGPNWYATVMGTAVVASAGATLPLDLPGRRTACAALWALSLVMLAVLLGARAVHWAHHRDQARAHLLDPAMAPFYGCLAMALLSVGAGAVTVGADWIGQGAAVALDTVLFTAGTAVGLAVAVTIPYLMVVRHRVEGASPVWLLPVVPPMVSAATGPLLVEHLPPGQWQRTLLIGCYGMFGLSLLATLAVLPLVFGRLVTGGPLPLALTPTLFLVLGPLGTSTTAAGAFADQAPPGMPYAVGFAVLYGVPVMGFALMWLVLAGAMALRASRRGMGFGMSWWAFTFPVGTCVTGVEGLARHTGLTALRWLAVALYALLLVAWLTAAVRTARGLAGGRLLAAPVGGGGGAAGGPGGRPAPAEADGADGSGVADGVGVARAAAGVPAAAGAPASAGVPTTP
ncbi:TDT family transporter [Streptomyces sp. NPDC015131]|uniref:TDT family transporter n=1 Tax=Streptomyces sp. NPDC015131 TaxID=3364941 RepID=UPI0036F64B7F